MYCIQRQRFNQSWEHVFDVEFPADHLSYVSFLHEAYLNIIGCMVRVLGVTLIVAVGVIAVMYECKDK